MWNWIWVWAGGQKQQHTEQWPYRTGQRTSLTPVTEQWPYRTGQRTSLTPVTEQWPYRTGQRTSLTPVTEQWPYRTGQRTSLTPVTEQWPYRTGQRTSLTPVSFLSHDTNENLQSVALSLRPFPGSTPQVFYSHKVCANKSWEMEPGKEATYQYSLPYAWKLRHYTIDSTHLVCPYRPSEATRVVFLSQTIHTQFYKARHYLLLAATSWGGRGCCSLPPPVGLPLHGRTLS